MLVFNQQQHDQYSFLTDEITEYLKSLEIDYNLRIVYVAMLGAYADNTKKPDSIMRLHCIYAKQTKHYINPGFEELEFPITNNTTLDDGTSLYVILHDIRTFTKYVYRQYPEELNILQTPYSYTFDRYFTDLNTMYAIQYYPHGHQRMLNQWAIKMNNTVQLDMDTTTILEYLKIVLQLCFVNKFNVVPPATLPELLHYNNDEKFISTQAIQAIILKHKFGPTPNDKQLVRLIQTLELTRANLIIPNTGRPTEHDVSETSDIILKITNATKIHTS